MTKEEAIELLEDLYGAIEDNHGRDYDEAFCMAIEALSAKPQTDLISRADAIEAVDGLKERPQKYYTQYNNALSDAILELTTLPSAEVVPLSVADKIGEECERLEDRVAELEEQLADTVSREDYHNLLMASNDIDRALREYQAKEEQLAEAVSCEPLDIFARMYRAERESARGDDAEADYSTCKHKNKDWGSEECDSCCRNNNHYEPVDAVQGEWIKTVDGNGWNEWYVFKCPFCGATIEDKQSRSWEYNFCPNCGAHMRGEVK